MSKDLNLKGRHVYIHGDLVGHVETYANENKIPFHKAINEIISDHIRKSNTIDENRPSTKKDIKKILKRIEIMSIMFEPAFLELLETASMSGYDAHDDKEKSKYGLEVKQKYAELFREIKEMI